MGKRKRNRKESSTEVDISTKVYSRDPVMENLEIKTEGAEKSQGLDLRVDQQT